MKPDPFKVLVLCTGNSCRSVMAEALINNIGRGRYQAWSAGTVPARYVHPKSIETLQRHGINPGHPSSKSLNEVAWQSYDLIITVCDQAAGESCPLFPGTPKKLHWSTPDPAKAIGSDDGGLIALSLQGGGVLWAAPIADSSSGSSPDGQQNVPSGMRDAESSSKMQRDKDGAGIADTQSHRIGGQFGTSSQRADTDTPKTPGSRLTERSGITGSGSAKPGATGGGSSSGMSGESGAGTDPNAGAEQTSANPCESRGGQTVVGADQEHGNDGHTIRGEVLRVEDNTLVVKRQDGKEVSLHTDQTKENPNITQGDYIQANVNEQNQALWIGPLKSTDRRNEHEVDCR